MLRRRIVHLAVAGATVLLVTGAAGVALAGTDQPTPTTPDPVTAIVGGHAPSQPYPGMASLQITHPRTGQPDFHSCGAQLFSGLWAYTAAHCVTGQDGTPYPASWNLHLRVGSPDRTSGGTVAAVAEIIVHADWAWGAIPDAPVADIAMLRLASYVDLPAYPIPGRQPRLGATIRELGWGLTEPDGGGITPTLLREIDTRRLPDSRCLEAFITAGETCVANPHGTDGACFGDSGGPGLANTDRRWASVGITSRGTDDTAGMCGTGPVVMTDVVHYRDWLYQVARTGVAPPSTVDKPTADLLTASSMSWHHEPLARHAPAASRQ